MAADWYGADRFDFRLGLLRRIGPDPDPDPDPRAGPDPRDLRFLAIMSSRDISNPVDILRVFPIDDSLSAAEEDIFFFLTTGGGRYI